MFFTFFGVRKHDLGGGVEAVRLARLGLQHTQLHLVEEAEDTHLLDLAVEHQLHYHFCRCGGRQG